jgi:lipocalin
MQKPGKWLEEIYGNPVNYTVIAIDTDYSVEYDCVTNSVGVTNYCIHVLSRTREMDQATFDKLIQQAEDMGLNPQGLPVIMTKQEGCV